MLTQPTFACPNIGDGCHLKKAPVVTSAATEADQPGMGMTNRVIPLREKSGERLSRSLGWMGTPP
jgi:hypothetical protein